MGLKIERIDKEYIDRFINDEYPIEVTQEKILDFVEYTNHIDRSKEERVLVLALEIKSDDFKKGWEDIRLLYDYTLDHCSKEEKFDYLIDWIVNALDWSNTYLEYVSSYEERIKIADECLLKLEDALSLRPNKASIHHLFGNFYYDHPKVMGQIKINEAECHEFIRKALSHFLEAFTIEPLKYISCFYIAHCYHDLKDWGKALLYYQKIDTTFFIKENPHWEWRVWKAEEQICLCYAMLGEIDKSKMYFDVFLSKVEKMKEEPFDDLIVNFDESFQLIDKIKDTALTKRLVDIAIRKGYENRYKKEIEQLQATIKQ